MYLARHEVKHPCGVQDANKAMPLRKDQVDHQTASKEARLEVAWWSEALESETFAGQQVQCRMY